MCVWQSISPNHATAAAEGARRYPFARAWPAPPLRTEPGTPRHEQARPRLRSAATTHGGTGQQSRRHRRERLNISNQQEVGHARSISRICILRYCGCGPVSNGRFCFAGRCRRVIAKSAASSADLRYRTADRAVLGDRQPSSVQPGTPRAPRISVPTISCNSAAPVIAAAGAS